MNKKKKIEKQKITKEMLTVAYQNIYYQMNKIQHKYNLNLI